MSKQTDKCARKQEHEWVTEKETRDVIIKLCTYCKGHKYVTRRN